MVAALRLKSLVAEIVGVAVEMSRVHFFLLQRSDDSFGAENRVLIVLVDDIIFGVGLVVDVVGFNDVDVGVAVLAAAQRAFVVAVEVGVATVDAAPAGDKSLLLEILIFNGTVVLLLQLGCSVFFTVNLFSC